MAAADPSMPFSPCDPAAGSCTDVSVGILQWIFGPVVEKLTQGASPDAVDASVSVMASIFSVFNSGLLVVASLIVSYVAVMGVTNTANEGEAMGRNWSSLWTPMRIVSGGSVLLPTTSGYSFIQLIVMMFALWGDRSDCSRHHAATDHAEVRHRHHQGWLGNGRRLLSAPRRYQGRALRRKRRTGHRTKPQHAAARAAFIAGCQQLTFAVLDADPEGTYVIQQPDNTFRLRIGNAPTLAVGERFTVAGIEFDTAEIECLHFADCV